MRVTQTAAPADSDHITGSALIRQAMYRTRQRRAECELPVGKEGAGPENESEDGW